MAKVIMKDEKQLTEAKNKTKGTLSYRKTKDGRVIVAAVPMKKKKRK